MAIYECTGCNELLCDNCSPSSSCNFCSDEFCSECEQDQLKEDSRSRVACSVCIDGMSNIERKDFNEPILSMDRVKSKKAKGKKGSKEDIFNALNNLGE